MIYLRVVIAFIAAIVGMILVAPVFLLAIPLLLVSIVTRALSRVTEPRFLTRDQLIEFDAHFGWKPRPNLRTHHLMVDLFQLTTDADGWRGCYSLEESEVVVIGDSFAAGYGVGERHFFANLKANPKIKPIGIGGYSMVQELLWMRHLVSYLQRKLVIWFIYHGNDLYDNLSPDLRGYRKPFIRERKEGDWEVVSSHINPAQWTIATRVRLEGQHHLAKLAELCSDTFLAQRAYDACQYLIGEGQKICKDARAELLVMTIPDPCQLKSEGQRALKARGGNPNSFDPFLPDKQIEAACRRWGVGFLASRTFLDASCYKTNDCHWNAKGHRKISDMIVCLYKDHARKVTVPEAEPSGAFV